MALPGPAFVAHLQAAIDPLHEEIMAHPLFAEWFAGALSLQRLRGYCCQAYLWKQYSTELFPVMLPKSPPDVRRLIVENLVEELGHGAEPAHSALLVRFGEEIGVPADAMRQGEPILEVDALCNFLSRLFHERSYLELAAAYNFAFEGLLAKKYPRIVRALRAHYGISEAGLRFWDIHEEADTQHRSDGEAIMARYCLTDEQQERAVAIAKLGLAHRLRAIDGCYTRFAG